MINLSKSPLSWQIRTLISVVTILSMISWRCIVIERQPSHLITIAEEIGSLAQTRVGIYPNSDGSSFIYFQETKTGLGTYLGETDTGKSHILFEEDEKGYGDQYRMLGWSPDNTLLAYLTAATTNSANVKLVNVYNGHDGELLATVPASAYASDSQFIWLSNHSFIYSTHNHRSWLVFETDANGKWSETQVIKRFASGRLANLIAISPHSVAWLTNDDIRILNLQTSASEKLWTANSTNKVISFSYAAESGNYLLDCTNKDGRSRIIYRPPGLLFKNGTILESVRNPDREKFVDLDMSHGRFSFTIKTDEKSTPVNFIWNGMLRYYGLGGNYLFFTGNQPDGIPGIWQYDEKTGSTKCIVEGLKTDLKYSRMVLPFTGVITNRSGKTIYYHLWPPANLIPGKRYPLILGQSLNSWNPCAQIAANAGYYFATVDLPNWINAKNTWEEDVMQLYATLNKEKGFDTNQVYFIAYSAQAWDASQVISNHPGLCKGLILFRPAALPSLPPLHSFSIFITAGTDDDSAPFSKLLQFQNEALKFGVPVDLSFQTGVQHVIRATQTESEESIEFASYLLEHK